MCVVRITHPKTNPFNCSRIDNLHPCLAFERHLCLSYDDTSVKGSLTLLEKSPICIQGRIEDYSTYSCPGQCSLIELGFLSLSLHHPTLIKYGAINERGLVERGASQMTDLGLCFFRQQQQSWEMRVFGLTVLRLFTVYRISDRPNKVSQKTPWYKSGNRITAHANFVIGLLIQDCCPYRDLGILHCWN